MPELPDLEIYCRNLNKLLSDKTVARFKVFNPRCVNGDLDRFQGAAVGGSCTVSRYGKELFIKIKDDVLGVHLMLDGALFFGNAERIEREKDKLFAIEFYDGDELLITDRDGYAKITCFAKPDLSVPDALSDDFTYEYFYLRLSSTRKAVKAMLLEQGFVKGIGNAYSDEILWAARIHPDSSCNKLPEKQLNDLYRCIKAELQRGIDNITAKNPDAIRGEERSFMAVHNPNKKYSPTGEPIQIKTTVSKRTYYTAEQILYK